MPQKYSEKCDVDFLFGLTEAADFHTMVRLFGAASSFFHAGWPDLFSGAWVLNLWTQTQHSSSFLTHSSILTPAADNMQQRDLSLASCLRCKTYRPNFFCISMQVSFCTLPRYLLSGDLPASLEARKHRLLPPE